MIKTEVTNSLTLSGPKFDIGEEVYVFSIDDNKLARTKKATVLSVSISDWYDYEVVTKDLEYHENDIGEPISDCITSYTEEGMHKNYEECIAAMLKFINSNK